MERHTGLGAHERSEGTAGGVWTVEKHFSWQKAPDVPSGAQLADFTNPLAKKGDVICGLKTVPLATKSPGPAELIKGAWPLRSAPRRRHRPMPSATVQLGLAHAALRGHGAR